MKGFKCRAWKGIKLNLKVSLKLWLKVWQENNEDFPTTVKETTCVKSHMRKSFRCRSRAIEVKHKLEQINLITQSRRRIYLAYYYFHCQDRGEREFPFPAIFGNTGLPFPSRKSGMKFSTPIPVPEKGEWNFHYGSRSRKLGMEHQIWE